MFAAWLLGCDRKSVEKIDFVHLEIWSKYENFLFLFSFWLCPSLVACVAAGVFLRRGGGGGGRDKIRSFIYTGIIFVKKNILPNEPV